MDRGRTATKRHLISEGQGLPLAVALSAANVNDYGQLLPLLDQVEPEPGGQVLADRGYDAEDFINELRSMNVRFIQRLPD